MPIIKGRFGEFLQRQFSFPSSGSNETSTSSFSSSVHEKLRRKRSSRFINNNIDDTDKGCFINKYLNGKLQKHHPDIICGKTCYDLPVKEIAKLSHAVVATCTGPGGGLTEVNRYKKPFELPDADVDFIDEDYSASNDSLDVYYGGSSSKNGANDDSSTCKPVVNGNGDIHKSNHQSRSGDRNCNAMHSRKNSNNDKEEEDDNGSNDSNDSDDDDNDEHERDHETGKKMRNKSKRSKNKTKRRLSDYHKSATLPLGEEVAGITCWERPSEDAYGIATTLYECHPVTKEQAGEPIADSFGICVRENGAILALADGVNWGEKACLAARCAVHGCIDSLNKALYSEGGGAKIQNTMDIFVCLLRSFNAAHNLILQENGMLTTLCAAVICQLKNSDHFIVCTCNVGDSLAYVFSKEHGVREITQGSHDIYSMRDMRDALGALGPVDGQNPELNNLTVAMTIVDPGDIVFLTSDGISDNFDPVVGKFAIPKKAEKPQSAKTPSTETPSEVVRQSRLKRSNSNPDRETAYAIARDFNLPIVSAHQRHELTLLRMEDLLYNGVNQGDNPCTTAKQLCELMIEFSSKLTMAKRRILEDPDLYDEHGECGDGFGQYEQRYRRRRVGDKLAMVPGKLDHASIVAYKVAFYGDYEGKIFEDKRTNCDKKYNLKLKATLARFESQEEFGSLFESTI